MYNVATNEMDQINGALIDRLYEKACTPLTNEESLDVSDMIIRGRSSIEYSVFRTSRNIFTSEKLDGGFKPTKLSVAGITRAAFNIFALN